MTTTLAGNFSRQTPTNRIYGNATVASELSQFKETHDCTAFHCTSFLNFVLGISPRIERSGGPAKKRVVRLERDGRRGRSRTKF